MARTAKYTQIVANFSWIPNPHVGYSVGKWEGNTHVVDSAGFNDKTWLDAFGHPHSEAMRILERFRRRDFGHMGVHVTIDDPEMYARPFTITFRELLLLDGDILESVCNENERDHPRLPGRPSVILRIPSSNWTIGSPNRGSNYAVWCEHQKFRSFRGAYGPGLLRAVVRIAALVYTETCSAFFSIYEALDVC